MPPLGIYTAPLPPKAHRSLRLNVCIVVLRGWVQVYGNTMKNCLYCGIKIIEEDQGVICENIITPPSGESGVSEGLLFCCFVDFILLIVWFGRLNSNLLMQLLRYGTYGSFGLLRYVCATARAAGAPRVRSAVL